MPVDDESNHHQDAGAAMSHAGESLPGSAETQGYRLTDRYVVESELGRGGFAVAYLARDRQLHDKPVVLKVLHDKPDSEYIRREFEREIKALARINHPGVLSVLDRGFMPGGQPALVLQYV